MDIEEIKTEWINRFASSAAIGLGSQSTMVAIVLWRHSFLSDSDRLLTLSDPKALSSSTGIGKITVRKCLAELNKLGIIQIAGPRRLSRRTFYYYQLAPPDEWNNIDQFYRQSSRYLESRAGYLYLLQHGAHYKIGRSYNLGKRLETLERILPVDTELFHIIATNDIVLLETYWHSRFAHYRRHGEWFELSQEALDDITAHNEMEVEGWGDRIIAYETFTPVVTNYMINEINRDLTAGIFPISPNCLSPQKIP